MCVAIFRILWMRFDFKLAQKILSLAFCVCVCACRFRSSKHKFNVSLLCRLNAIQIVYNFSTIKHRSWTEKIVSCSLTLVHITQIHSHSLALKMWKLSSIVCDLITLYDGWPCCMAFIAWLVVIWLRVICHVDLCCLCDF